MVYKNNNAVAALNSYVWKLLEGNLGWTKADYQGLVPIIPLAQQPELMEIGKAFIVYGSTVQQANHLYSLKGEVVAYTIYAPTVSESNKIAQLLIDAFERQDLAAQDVNNWLDVERASTNVNRNISFGSVKNTMSQKAQPADEEGGYNAAFVLLEMKYTADNSTIVTTGFTVT